MDNIDWADVNTFSKKSYDLAGGNTTKASTSNENQEEDEDEEGEEDLEPEETEDEKNNEELSRIETFRKMVQYLKPNESILRAIKRLGNTSSSSNSSNLSASQRWSKKKTDTTKNNVVDSEQSKKDKESLEKLTGLANYFIDQGFYDIYEETLESLELKIKNYETRMIKPKQTDASFDMFADEIDNKNIGKANGEREELEDNVVKWIYKMTSSESDTKIHGPLTSQQMLEKTEKGDFGDSGVWCRKVTDSSGTFYNSKRIDFDLYT